MGSRPTISAKINPTSRAPTLDGSQDQIPIVPELAQITGKVMKMPAEMPTPLNETANEENLPSARDNSCL